MVVSLPLPQSSLDHLIIPYDDSPVDYGVFSSDNSDFKDEPAVSRLSIILYLVWGGDWNILWNIIRLLPVTTLARSGKVITFMFHLGLRTQLAVHPRFWKKDQLLKPNVFRWLDPVLCCKRGLLHFRVYRAFIIRSFLSRRFAQVSELWQCNLTLISVTIPLYCSCLASLNNTEKFLFFYKNYFRVLYLVGCAPCNN